MQKKLLMIFMVVNCVMIHANDLQGVLADDNQSNASIVATEVTEDSKKKEMLAQELADYEAQKNLLHKTRLIEEELADYKSEKTRLYKAALLKALYEEATAIDNLFITNETEYKTEEQNSKKLQDDTVVGDGGFFGGAGSRPTIKTINGRILNYIVKRREGKAAANVELKQSFNGYKAMIDDKVMSVLEQEIMHINYEMEKTFYHGLEQCGTDKKCLLSRNVHWPLTEDFFDQFINAATEPVIKVVKENNIPLTNQEVVEIARKRVFKCEDRELSLASAEEYKTKVMNKLHDLLNPKKNDKDLKDDQNDQGALSQ